MGQAGEAPVPPDLRTVIELLLEEVEHRYGWPLTRAPSRLSIKLHRDGTMRLYGELEEHVREPGDL